MDIFSKDSNLEILEKEEVKHNIPLEISNINIILNLIKDNRLGHSEVLTAIMA